MKKLFSVLLIAGLSGCAGNDGNYKPQQNNVTIENNTTAGFDVNKLAAIVKTSTDPEKLEKAINDQSNNINNLDLDSDGKVDYLKVIEKSNNKLDIVDDVSKDQSVTVASINITPQANNNTAEMAIQGNPAYVSQPYYHSSFGITDFLLLSYLLRPHSYYMPMYHYGYYPSYYRPRTVTTYRSYGGGSRGGYSSPSSSYNRSSLSSPSRSQRSFQERSSSSPVRSGGFGRSSSGSSRSSFGSGRSSFGSGRSGFGRRR